MLKLMLVIPTLDRAGAEKQLTLLATRLPKDRFDVSVCTLTRGGYYEQELNAAGVPVHHIDKQMKVDPLAYFRLKRQFQKVRPDIVHTWLFAANSYGRRAAYAAGVPTIICGERCVDPWKVSHEHWIDRLLDRQTKRIAVNSSGIVDFYQEHGRDPNKFVVIPNGLSIDTNPPDQSKEAIWNSLNLPPDAQIMLAVGRLWPQKRTKDLIWATEILKRVRDDAYLVIAGDGPQRSRLERYAQQVTIDDRVRFAGHRADVADLMKHASVFLLASGYEGQSNALMEAMSYGVPSVVSDIAGNRELIQHEQNGYLVDVGQRTEFSKFANYLLADESLRKQIGQAAKSTIADNFTVSQMVERYAQLYESLA